MTAEDEEFQRIEREAARRLEAVVATVSSQRTWIGLTDEELKDLMAIYSGVVLYRAIEAKLKMKNMR